MTNVGKACRMHTPAFQVTLVFPPCQAHRLFLGLLVYLLGPNLQDTSKYNVYKMPLYIKINHTIRDIIRNKFLES